MSMQDVEAFIEEALPRLPGWCTTEKGKRMAALAKGTDLCVELGVFGGRSMLAMVVAVQDHGHGRVDGVDPYTAAAALEGANDPANDEWWSGLPYEEIADRTERLLANYTQAGFARLIRKRSADAVAEYADESIDLLHQDSNHSELVSCEEVALWAPKMKPGGVWVFDDTNWPTTQAAQRMLFERGYTLQEDHTAWRVFRVPRGRPAKIVTKTVKELVERGEGDSGCPLPLSVIPNHMGINLVAVDAVTWTEQDDGQIVNLTIHFIPEQKP